MTVRPRRVLQFIFLGFLAALGAASPLAGQDGAIRGWSSFLIKPFEMEKALTNLKVWKDLVLGEQNPNPLE